MSIAAKLAVEHGLKHRGTDYPLEDAIAAIDEALELAAQEAEKEAVEYTGEETGSPQDEAYNAALTHAAEAIRALKSPAQEPESA